MSQNTQSAGNGTAEPMNRQDNASPVLPGGQPASPRPTRRRRGRWLALGFIFMAGLAGFAYRGVPWLLHSLNHETTDDSYVNSYVTYVSPRLPAA